MAPEPQESTADITAIPDHKFVIAMQGEDVTGELFMTAHRDAIGADTVPLASAQSTMRDRDELVRFRDRINKLLGETLDVESIRQRLVGDIIESVKRVAAKYDSSPDATHTRSVLDEVAAEHERQREERVSGHDDEMTPVGWTNLHEDHPMQVAAARGSGKNIYSELPAEAIDRRESNDE